MTHQDIIDELGAISTSITANHANPNLPAKQALVRACLAVESLRALLIEDLRRTLDGAARWPEESPCDDPPPEAEAGSWRTRPPML